MNKAFEEILSRLEDLKLPFPDACYCGTTNDLIEETRKVVQKVDEEYNNVCCEHKWLFQESQHKTTVTGYEHYTAHYHRVDVFFCEKCCEIKKDRTERGC